ncbi:MAG: Phage Terminase [Acidobacteria bacterium ADurb.Bin051]|nr:MAG: Phage Terminase [Acidobacteria bacterium ADurb.Bin051]
MSTPRKRPGAARAPKVARSRRSPRPIWQQYAEDVVAGTVPAGRLVRLAAERFLADLSHYGTARSRRALWLDEAAADRAVRFFPKLLRHHKGEWSGQPFELAPWQAFIIANLLGWKRQDGTRRFRKGLAEVPRKNGKTQLGAGLGLYLLTADGEPGAEIYAAATKRDQATILHDEATRMVRSSPALRARVGVFRQNLHVLQTHSKFEPLGADHNTLDGLNPSAVLVDELHAHKTRHLLDVLETAMGSRRQPLLFAITTAGHSRASVCWELHEYARQVLETAVDDPSFFAYVAAMEPGDDWTLEATWARANPNLGVSVKLDYLRRECEQAQRIIGKQNAFRRLHCNDWTEQRNRWLELEVWDRCSAPVDLDTLAGRRCFLGLDLSTNRDVTALVAYFPPEEEGEPGEVLPFFFIPEAGIPERVRGDGVPFDTWSELGLVTATPGDAVDYSWIRERIHRLREESMVDVVEIAYDPWGATQFAPELAAEGFVMVPTRQGWQTMAPALRELERLLLLGRLAHGGHPVLRWMVSNVAVVEDSAGNVRPHKGASADRIDGVVALAMAVHRASLHAGGTELEADDLLLVV